MEILIELSRKIKAHEPISLTSYEPEPGAYAKNDINRLLDTDITDILRRRNAGLPQTFSGFSGDSVTQEMIDEVR